MGEGKPRRELPITVIDSGKSVTEEAHAAPPRDADEGPRTLGQPAPPCVLFVGDTAISEAEIAREMQHHRAG